MEGEGGGGDEGYEGGGVGGRGIRGKESVVLSEASGWVDEDGACGYVVFGTSAWSVAKVAVAVCADSMCV